MPEAGLTRIAEKAVATNQLTRHQVDQIRRSLRERERTLRWEIREGLLRSGEERYKDIAGAVSGAGDESVADLLTDVGIAAVDRDVRELREVQDALARILRGQFGSCADCGAPIGFARLEANPAAARCHACQTRREHDFAHEDTPIL